MPIQRLYLRRLLCEGMFKEHSDIAERICRNDVRQLQPNRRVQVHLRVQLEARQGLHIGREWISGYNDHPIGIPTKPRQHISQLRL